MTAADFIVARVDFETCKTIPTELPGPDVLPLTRCS